MSVRPGVKGYRNLPADVYRRLCRARNFMDDCYDLPLDLDRISREACFSRYHFIRLFRQAFEQTPHQYLTRRRIERAKELLTSSRLTVTDVCFEVGFQSLGSFSSLFRKYVGHPPNTYRARIFIHRQSQRERVPFCFLVMYGIETTTTAAPLQL
ncbi:MAG TPA: AraC family transcriptional regulator [Pyrinomonadaceae bacterium]|jgi:AraC-like DNA-binding protein